MATDPSLRLTHLWREGRVAAPDDPYNCVRVLDYYLRALTAHASSLRGFDPSVVEKEMDYWEENKAEYRIGQEGLMDRYIRNVKARFSHLKMLLPKPHSHKSLAKLRVTLPSK